MTTLRQQAREAYADAIEAQGRPWVNTANNIRAGFENVWITPAIDAIQELLRLLPDEADDQGGGA